MSIFFFAGGIFLNIKPYLNGFQADNTINYKYLFSHLSNYIKSANTSILKKDFKNTIKELGDAITKTGFKVVL